MENKKIYGLDLLRGFAGYGVAVTHYLYFEKEKLNFEYYSFIFVEIFFVLSGFVLSKQLIKVYDNRKHIKIFYLRRLFRTIPLYIIALIFYTAISNNFNLDFFKFLFFIQKIIPNFVNDNYFMVAWSLSIEEFFYLFFPIYLIFFNRYKAAHLTIIFIIILSLIKIFSYENTSSDFIRTGTILRLDSIALGFLLGIYIETLMKFKKLNVFLTFLTFMILINFQSFFFYKNSINTIYFIFLSQFFSILLLIFFNNIEFLFKTNFLKKICTKLATQTYSVYLFHLIIMHFLIMTDMNFINNIFIYITLLFIVSSIIYKYIEKPILLLRPKYKNE
jgi:peptidoglycan/LPS O-acetylase OafA/YrhL